MQTALITADRLSSAELLDIWNRGFSGYYVDNTMDEGRLAKHIRWSAVDLSRSAVLLVDEKPAAFSLAAIERRGGGLAAWIAGFGVAPEHRRQGLAGQLMRGHSQMLDDAGVMETLLEVIDVNPARRVYSAAGFRQTRILLSYQGVPHVVREDGEPQARRLEPGALEELHAELHTRIPPVWRRELPAILRVLEDVEAAQLLAIEEAEAPVAYALAVPGAERVTLLDACAADAEAARRLVLAVAGAFGGKPLRIIDEPVESPMAEGFAEAGVPRFLTQLEMLRGGD